MADEAAGGRDDRRLGRDDVAAVAEQHQRRVSPSPASRACRAPRRPELALGDALGGDRRRAIQSRLMPTSPLGLALLVVLLDGGHDGGAGRADELGPVLGGPVPRARRATAASPGSGASRSGRTARRSAASPRGRPTRGPCTGRCRSRPTASTSRSIWATASSGVPMTAKPDAFMASASSSASSVVGRQRQGGHPPEVVDPVGSRPNSTSLRRPAPRSRRCASGRPAASRRRSTVVPNSAARSSMTSQWSPSTSKPPSLVAPIDSSEQPNRPAARGPAGETWAATATSKCGSVYGPQLEPGVAQREPVGLAGDRLVAASRARIASSASSIISRCLATSMPIMKASDGSAPGPDAEHRPGPG